MSVQQWVGSREEEDPSIILAREARQHALKYKWAKNLLLYFEPVRLYKGEGASTQRNFLAMRCKANDEMSTGKSCGGTVIKGRQAVLFENHLKSVSHLPFY